MLASMLAGGLPTRAMAADQDVLTMPLQCTVQGGRVTLTPAAGDRTYRILGSHENHPFTACAANAPDVCRTWTVHKFDLACDGGRVAWINVVAAFLEATPRRAWVEAGRVHFRMGPRWNGPAYDGACDPQRNAGAPSADCKRSASTEGGAVIALPAGFAPMLSTGGRFVPSGTSPQTVAAAEPVKELAKDARAVAAPAPGAQATPRIAADVPAKPRETGSIRPAAASPPVRLVADTGGWETTTAPLSAADVVDRDAAERKRVYVLTMIAMMLLATSFAIAQRWWSDGVALPPSWLRFGAPRSWMMAWWSSPPVAAAAPRTAAAAPHADQETAEVSTALIADAVRTHQTVRQIVAGLNALTLKDVLTTDLDGIRQRLLSSELTQKVTAQRWREVRTLVEAVIADLERVRRIAVSAAALEIEARTVVAMPSTTAEAFDILGVNADARLPVVKKIVDALRQSWHPDHARGEDDRQAREERIKQINVAWDLIARRQKAA